MLRTRGSHSWSLAFMVLLATSPAWTTPVTAFADATPVAPAATPVPLEAPIVAAWTIANPSGVFLGFDSIWVPGHHDLTTTRINPATNEVVAVIEGTGDHAE